MVDFDYEKKIEHIEISLHVLLFLKRSSDFSFPEQDDTFSLSLYLDEKLHDFFVEVDAELVSSDDNLPTSLVFCFQNRL